MPIDPLSDLKIIVTGGASGIGKATSRLLAQGGARRVLP
ncbi:SDR family oxidoreductase [Alterinioella nitratireducens]|jgi:NAD(P)-dependent dehydrogenase (short-subunit alcohol dehydrogenase family)|nr:SDR family oxidoreductase [Alterinioella nitratireducens]NPD18973.1 SDR family oxidoreductase [Alterinioella nitratireducens]